MGAGAADFGRLVGALHDVNFQEMQTGRCPQGCDNQWRHHDATTGLKRCWRQPNGLCALFSALFSAFFSAFFSAIPAPLSSPYRCSGVGSCWDLGEMCTALTNLSLSRARAAITT